MHTVDAWLWPRPPGWPCSPGWPSPVGVAGLLAGALAGQLGSLAHAGRAGGAGHLPLGLLLLLEGREGREGGREGGREREGEREEGETPTNTCIQSCTLYSVEYVYMSKTYNLIHVHVHVLCMYSCQGSSKQFPSEPFSSCTLYSIVHVHVHAVGTK